MSHEITNPPSPPFSKGGLGGFENHFGHWILEPGNYLGFGICHLEFKLIIRNSADSWKSDR